jgi:uncharacterized protein (TIGR02246 family)
MKLLTVLAALVVSVPAVAAAQAGAPAGTAASTAAIDEQVWSAISASVVNQDIDAMAATYHPDAVVVTPGRTVPARTQLPQWGKDMETAKARGETATVEFRFTKRLDNAETAFETGMFKYTVVDSAGKATSYHIPMESLLIRANGRWVVVMEHQFAAATPQEWEALKP